MTAPCTVAAVASHVAIMREHPNVAAVTCAHGTRFQLTTIGTVLATTETGRVVHLIPPAAADVRPATTGRCPEALRRRIKLLQKRARLSDAAYRALLAEETGKTSSTVLTEAEAQRVARALDAQPGNVA